MSSYEIAISPEQREILVTALTYLTDHPTMLGADAETRDETLTLLRLFNDLPAADSDENFATVNGKRRHILHGFCL